MIPFVTKLLMSGQLKFEKGQMSIFGQRVLIFPLEMVKIIMKESINDPKFATSIYKAAKESVMAFSNDVSDRLNIHKEKEMLDILFKLTEMNGYGTINPIKIDYENKTAILHLEGLPSKTLLGKVKNAQAGDVYWCGLVAGGMSYVFKEDVEAVETSCVITGKESCEIMAGNKKFLEGKLKESGMPKPPYL